MKKIQLLLIAAIIFIAGCKKTSTDQTEPSVSAVQTVVQVAQVIQLKSGLTLNQRYEGTFGETAVEITRTSDSTLAFIIPEVSPGGHQLKFSLGTINFTVNPSVAVDADQIATKAFENFDGQLDGFDPANEQQLVELNEISQFRDEVETLVNSLTAAQKIEMARFYEANKASFHTFSTNTIFNLNASTTMRQQSECPTTNFQEFYGCTAGNLANASMDLGAALRDMGSFAGLGYIAAVTSPASFGLGAGAATIAFTTAAYILVMEVKPAAFVFLNAAGPFLKANWLLAKGLFLLVKDKFNSESTVDLGIKPVFRSVESTDAEVNAGLGSFIPSFRKLEGPWNKFKVLLGTMPVFTKTEEPAGIKTAELVISDISNPNVQLVSQVDGNVKFKSLTGKEETFKYKAKVTKEGFTETAELSGTVTISALKVGDQYAGGRIFHLDASGQHGYVVSEELGRFKWDSARASNGITYQTVTIGGLGEAMGTGAANTIKIKNTPGTNPRAVQVCQAYRGGGFSDWFLPSLDEVMSFTEVLTIADGFYWASSETIQNGGQVYAAKYGYSTVEQRYRFTFDAKWNESRVRAVRAF